MASTKIGKKMELENTLVIVSDLGELKVYKPVKHEVTVNGGSEVKVSWSLDLVTDLDYIAPHKKISEIVTDKAGNFKHGTVEDNQIKDTLKQRTLKEIAEIITKVVADLQPKQLFLAFPKEDHQKLIETLPNNVKSLITKDLAADLIKEDKNKILDHFQS